MSNYGKQVILEMARFLRENPSATVNQLSDHMGWAENRSVYYWLNQVGFTGIRDFRRAAMDRSLPFFEEDVIREDSCKTYIPIVQQIDSPKHYKYAEEDFLCQINTSRKSFAYQVTNSLWTPVVLKGDLLVIDPEVKPEEQDLFLAWVRGSGTILLRKIGDGYFVKDPFSLEVLKDPTFSFIGSVVLLYRVRKNLKTKSLAKQ